MKKVYLTPVLLIMAIFFGKSATASHLVGGQITAKQLSNLQYEVSCTLYRDSMGLNIGQTETLAYFDATNNQLVQHTIPHDPGIQIGGGVEMYIFRDTITFPSAGSYRVEFGNCCRNGGIINLFNASSSGMGLSTQLEVGNNSSPYFLNHPVPFAQVNQPFTYNPLAIDTDADSLSWSLANPLSFLSFGNLSPAAGYSHPAALTTDPFTIDPYTGEIRFTPSLAGIFVAAVTCTEFRNGVSLGTVHREMQFRVGPSANSPSIPAFQCNVPSSGPNAYTLNVNQNFSFQFDVSDSDGHGQSIAAMGEPFLSLSNPATFTASSGTGNATLSVQWSPDASQVREQPYLLNIRRTEHLGPILFSNDMTFRLFVNPTPTINNPEEKTPAIKIWPNPANNEIWISESQKHEGQTKTEILELGTGKIVFEKTQETTAQAKFIRAIDIRNIPNGMYLVRVTQNNETVEITRFAVAR